MEVRPPLWCKPEVGYSCQDPLHPDLEFQPRQVGSETAVYACPEAEVTVLAAIEDTAVGIGEDRLVSVGSGEVDDHRVTGPERVSAQLDVLGDGSV